MIDKCSIEKTIKCVTTFCKTDEGIRSFLDIVLSEKGKENLELFCMSLFEAVDNEMDRKKWFSFISCKLDLSEKLFLIDKIKDFKNKVILFEYLFEAEPKTKILFFDGPALKHGLGLENKTIHEYQLFGLSDYTKILVLDNTKNNLEDRTLSIHKVVNLDLNILNFLNDYSNGKYKQSDEFKNFLTYLKENKFEYNMSTAVMERSKNKFDENAQMIWRSSILNYLKFTKIECDIADITSTQLTNEEQKKADGILQGIFEESENKYNHYDMISCLVIKAFLIKMDKNINNKTETLLEYSLSILNVYLENEIILLHRYFNHEESVKRTFKKIESYSKNTTERLLNTVWDIFHVRLLELQMSSDNVKSDEVYLHYFSSHDKAFAELMEENPLKMFVIHGGNQYAIRKIGIQDICENSMLLKKIEDEKEIRKKQCQSINYKEIRKQLLNEVQVKSDSLM